MYQVVGVRFKKAGKIYYFDPGDHPVEKDQFVIVETSRGIEYGKVVTPIKGVGEEDVVLPLKKVIRIATPEDKVQVEKNKAAAEKAYDICLEKIAEHGLEMKLVDVEYTFDRNKVIFYFTADGRVDFRELVKDLAAIFRTRIELRQIGVRDEAKMLGGIGPCGRILCCSSFLGDFEPVSIKMAKDQNLSLNPAKISGLCGRLMCCLKYENDQYESAIKELPDLGEETVTPLGAGRVVGLNILEKLIQVELKDTERVVEFTLDELMDHQSQDEALPSQAEGAPN
ncbi:PSP1 domain protein [Caldalkalibacillus thermarum TA2.A1]|uniref:PSP1 domain protein n=1 Tax=Caldalkalibacillus thermarum (strain TA2.A1) TaxID=986075 RepID=F5L9X3_CALTT|nr:stage 0 sporulation family protein [Caldalkalibacillus thermarum]EGL81843.1 PSP1 domain protein [Caldalkalibacillus thermarum TA2.A1]QZT34332.1 stage 0 sporulation family protein [Caldalkalibacillus thermarum TA2.A1]